MVDYQDPRDATVDTVPAARSLTRLRALLSELGADMGTWDEELPDDPLVASYHLAAMSPVGPLDAQRLLEAPSPSDRVELVTELADDLVDVVRAQLRGT